MSILALDREYRSYEELLGALDEVSGLYQSVEILPRPEWPEEAEEEEEFLELESSIPSSEFEELVRAWILDKDPDLRIAEGLGEPPDEGKEPEPPDGDGIVRDDAYYAERVNTSIYDQNRELIE